MFTPALLSKPHFPCSRFTWCPCPCQLLLVRDLPCVRGGEHKAVLAGCRRRQRIALIGKAEDDCQVAQTPLNKSPFSGAVSLQLRTLSFETESHRSTHALWRTKRTKNKIHRKIQECCPKKVRWLQKSRIWVREDHPVSTKERRCERSTFE